MRAYVNMTMTMDLGYRGRMTPRHGVVLMRCVLLFLAMLSARWRAFADQLYQQYHHVLRRRCRRLLREDHLVDDAMQEIFWTICKQGKQYRGEPDKILPWLYRVTTTHCLKLLEKNKRWTRNVDLAMEEGAQRYQANLNARELEQLTAAKALLMRLPPSVREAVLYRFASGMTQQEIAEVMDVTRDQVRTWLKQFEERRERWLAQEQTQGEGA